MELKNDRVTHEKFVNVTPEGDSQLVREILCCSMPLFFKRRTAFFSAAGVTETYDVRKESA